MAHELININSPWANDPDAVEEAKVFAEDHINFLTHTWDATPVYLVDPPTMDKAYPPERRTLLVEKSARQMFRELRRNDKDSPEDLLSLTDHLLEQLKGHCVKQNIKFLGVFFSSSHNPLPNLSVSTPCVLICPDRILSLTKRLLSQSSSRIKNFDTAFMILFAKVLFHELGHGFMADDRSGRQPRGEFWTRVVEESLANALAWGRFNPTERWLVNRMISGQPVEYRGYTFWQEFRSAEIRTMAQSWSAFTPHLPLMDVLFPQIASFRGRVRYYELERGMEKLAQTFANEDHPERFWREVSLRVLEEVLR